MKQRPQGGRLAARSHPVWEVRSGLATEDSGTLPFADTGNLAQVRRTVGARAEIDRLGGNKFTLREVLDEQKKERFLVLYKDGNLHTLV